MGNVILFLKHRNGAIALIFLICACGVRTTAAPSVIAYVGTGTESPVNGIYAFRYDEATGALDPLGLVANTPHPTFLAMHPSGRFLYAVNEANPDHQYGHSVTAFSIEGQGPRLRLLDQVPCGGDEPNYVAVDPTGKFAFVADYGSGTIAAMPVRVDGGLESPQFVFQDPQPSSSNRRQQEPHAHCTVLDPSNRFLYSCDLGDDRVMIYRFDAQAGVLSRNAPASAAVPPGFGPRHIAFGRGGRTAYVLNEIASTLVVFDRNAEDGSLAARQVISTLPAHWSLRRNTAAEIALDHSGRFLYASNRGHDSIAVFAVGTDGSLRLVDFTACGKQPRFFTVDPSGKFLLVGDEGGDAVVVFQIDPASGRLIPTASRVSVPNPVCIVFGNPLPPSGGAAR
jgi:6-phosphogluconolactonase